MNAKNHRNYEDPEETYPKEMWSIKPDELASKIHEMSFEQKLHLFKEFEVWTPESYRAFAYRYECEKP